MSLLAGGGYIERTLRTRTASSESARSPSPPPETPPSPAASPSPESPPLPAVKGVVEKHDSVSWVLEIEETPEEVASRLVILRPDYVKLLMNVSIVWVWE